MLEILTILAIFVGPITALLISRELDRRREQHNRRMDIFRTLMRTRRNVISPDHVGALNLVEIEFAHDKQVLDAWKKLFEHFAERSLNRENEQITADTLDQKAIEKNRRLNENLATEHQSRLAKLLHAIAKQLRFKAEQLEILEGGYTPKGWEDLESEQRIIRQYFLDLYSGKSMVPVSVIDFRKMSSGDPSD